jgi:CheY-like chemotaxis protein
MKDAAPYILLADDNPDDRSFIRDSFDYMRADIQLKLVDGGKELLQRLDVTEEDELPSLIVLDYNMPELNGAEVLEKLSKNDRYKEIPKIMLSTSLYQKHIDHCMMLGAQGYLVKPDNMFKWKELARNILDYVKSSDRKQA